MCNELIRTWGHFDTSSGLFNYLKEAFTISRGAMICLWELKNYLRKQSSIPHVGKQLLQRMFPLNKLPLDINPGVKSCTGIWTQWCNRQATPSWLAGVFSGTRTKTEQHLLKSLPGGRLFPRKQGALGGQPTVLLENDAERGSCKQIEWGCLAPPDLCLFP